MTTIRKRRNVTARTAAKRLGVTMRTIYSYQAEHRAVYEGRAAQRRETAGKMRAAGATWAEIAEAIEGTEWAARGLVRRYRLEQEQEQPLIERDPHTVDLLDGLTDAERKRRHGS